MALRENSARIAADGSGMASWVREPVSVRWNTAKKRRSGPASEVTPQPFGGEKTSQSSVAHIRFFDERVTPYASWALGILFLSNLLNFVDRKVIAVVATSIQRDLHITDADMGFLMGTAFATLYGIFGVGMGRIADALSRTRLLAAGLAVWSGMTVMSGLSVGFVSLALSRVGVGIGEAVGSPCAQPLLSDYFPQRNRALVLAAYISAAPLGGAAAMMIGGAIMQNWGQMCATFPGALCGIRDWQATFLLMGLPGLLLALLTLTLIEPRARVKRAPAHRVISCELSATVPPLTFGHLFASGGWAAIRTNTLLAGVILIVAAGIGAATGDWLQWTTVALGAYSLASWSQLLRLRDRPLYRLTFGSKTTVFATIGAAMTGTLNVSFTSWSVPYAVRELGTPPAQLGAYLGMAGLLAAVISAVVGGTIADRWKRVDPRAPIWMSLVSLVGPALALIVILQTRSLAAYTGGFFLFELLAHAWTGAFAAHIQEAVLPRMRGTATAIFGLTVTLVSLGVGPYQVGKVSELTGSLAAGIYSLLVLVPLGVPCLMVAAMRLRTETDDVRLARAAEAGEDLADP
jgi:MFS family permease